MTIYVCMSVCLHDERPRCSVDMRYAMDSDKVVPIDGRNQTLHVRAGQNFSRFLQAIALALALALRLIVWPSVCRVVAAHGAIVDDQVPNIAPCHVARP
jgi:hypothetical protein